MVVQINLFGKIQRIGLKNSPRHYTFKTYYKSFSISNLFYGLNIYTTSRYFLYNYTSIYYFVIEYCFTRIYQYQGVLPIYINIRLLYYKQNYTKHFSINSDNNDMYLWYSSSNSASTHLYFYMILFAFA